MKVSVRRGSAWRLVHMLSTQGWFGSCPSDSPSLDTQESPTGEVEAWLNPNPASCTRHPSLHFILPMAWDPFSAEVLHCCLPAVLALTRQHSCGTPQGGARDHCLELDNPSGMGSEACSPWVQGSSSSRVWVGGRRGTAQEGLPV